MVDEEDVRTMTLDAEMLAPYRARLAAWLEDHGVEAVLIRPDRYVFGAGHADELVAAWRHALAAAPRAV